MRGFNQNPSQLMTISSLFLTFSLRLGGRMRSQSVILKALPFIGNFIVKIINASLEQGVFLSARKRAQLIALKKVSAPSNPSDFRPITLLSFLYKVLEKIAHDQITYGSWTPESSPNGLSTLQQH